MCTRNYNPRIKTRHRNRHKQLRIWNKRKMYKEAKVIFRYLEISGMVYTLRWHSVL